MLLRRRTNVLRSASDPATRQELLMTLDDVTDAAVGRIREAAPTPPVADVLEQAADRLRGAVAEMRPRTPIQVVRLFAAGAVAVEWAAREHRMTGVCTGCGPHGCSAMATASALCDWAIALLDPDEALRGPGLTPTDPRSPGSVDAGGAR